MPRRARGGAAGRLSPHFAELRLRRLASGDGQILAGPFLGEVGFEVLYWIPMLNWFCERFGVDRGRLIAYSRGGPRSWYSHLGDRYLEVYEHATVEEVSRAREERVRALRTQKQEAVDEFDGRLYAAAAEELGGEPAWLHPSLMYGLYRGFLTQRAPALEVTKRARYRSLAPGESLPTGLEPPAEFVAVKAYGSKYLPADEQNTAFLSELLGRLSAKTNVVLLSTGLAVDDHRDLEGVGDPGQIQSIEGELAAADNLAVQSAVIGRATALFTTYGGFAHLGPFLGTPTFGFYSRERFYATHHDVMRRALQALHGEGSGGLVVANVEDMPLIELLAGGG